MKKLKLLYILNVAKRVNNFSYTSMLAAQELGIEFHIAGNWSYESDVERIADENKYGIKIFQVDFIRTPYHPGNRRAYKQLKEIVKEEKYDIIHCNTPIGGILGRMVGKKYNIPKVIYQAHGFHFFDGAPLLNWLIYYPIEKLFAHKTDALITINHEDFDRSKKFRLKNKGKCYYIPGVGIDLSPYESLYDTRTRTQKRLELGLKDTDIAYVSMGDLIQRKNYSVAIRALAKVNNDNIHYFICGKGPLENELKALAESLGVENRVHFLGFVTNIKEVLVACDAFLLTSLQEGLPRSMMEAMASGLPCIVSKIRGNVDLMENCEGGYLCSPTDIDAFAYAIKRIAEDDDLRKRMKDYNLEHIKEFDISVVEEEIKKFYEEVLS